MNPTFTVEIVVFLGFCMTGLLPAIMSWRMAHLMYVAMIKHIGQDEVIDGAAHYRRDQFLLVVGWTCFFAVGILAIFIPRQNPPPPLTVIGTLAMWMLLGSFGVWSTKTLLDFVYTRVLWDKRQDRIVQSLRDLDQRSQMVLTSEQVTTAQLNVITVVVEDTNDQVHDMQATAATNNLKNDLRMSDLEDSVRKQSSRWRQFIPSRRKKE